MEKDETAQLVCGVDAKPNVKQVKWTRNGRFIDTNFKHTIPRVTLQDSGTYVCSADNGLGQEGKSELKLDVLYGPVVTLEPAQRDFNKGDNIEIDCRVDANPRPSTIQWFKKGDERFVQNGPTLRLNGVMAKDNGQYICSATNLLQPTGQGKIKRVGNATIDVNIKHRPGKGFITSDKPKAVDGKKITLKCGANPPGYPKPTFIWTKQGSDSVLTSGSEYTIDPARLNNAGKYKCKPSNELGQGETAEFDLEVNQAPKIINELQPTIVKREGDTGFSITCSAIGKPKPKVKWFKDGQEILDSETNLYQISGSAQEGTIVNIMAFNVLSTLKFVGPERISKKTIMPDDRGRYTCRFENEVDAAESNMLLRIEHSPVVVHQHNKVAFDLDETAIISCKMQAYPPPRFDWSYGQSILQDRKFYQQNITALDNDIYEGILRINKVVETSYGDYTCKGINANGAKRTIIKLQRKGKPEKPVDVRAINIGYNFITVGFEPGFDGGYNNTSHSLEYRRFESSVPNYVDCFTATKCNITDLEQHSQYYIKIKASNIKGESKYTQEISVVTKLDKNKIPKPKSLHFEKTSNTASFLVENDVLPLVAKVQVKGENDDNWSQYDELSLNPAKPFSEISIQGLIQNLRVRLCLDTNEILCGPWTPAEFVDVRPPISHGVTLTNAHIAGLVVLAVLCAGFVACVLYCCCCKRNSTSTKKDNPSRPSIIHTTQPQHPPPYHLAGKIFKAIKTMYELAECCKILLNLLEHCRILYHLGES